MRAPGENEMIVGDKILPLIDNPPEFDKETQYLELAGFETLEDKVIKKYRVLNLIEEVPSETEMLKEKLREQDEVMQSLLFEIIPNVSEVRR